MRSIWIFGDSFAHYTPYDIWCKRIGELADATPYYFGEGGTSLEYTYEKFNDNRSHIKSNDIIILALTDINRRWFLRENLKDSIWDLMSQKTPIAEAITAQQKYLNCISIHETYFSNFLYNLEYLTRSRHTHTIILPCFDTTLNSLNLMKTDIPSIHIADRSLLDISTREFEDPSLLQHYTNTIQGDLRRCHFIKSNHYILADKLYENITTKKSLSLRKGFVEGVLNKNSLKSEEFAHSELYDVHLIPEHEYWDRTSLL